MKKLLVLIFACLLLGSGCVSAPAAVTVSNSSATSTSALPEVSTGPFALPLEHAGERVTKKPFGLQVTPKDSPVSPERFSGYHAGTDFETFANEQDRDIEVFAVCDGALALKKTATGYGGVVVQRCVLDDQPVTVVYGHLKLSSVTVKTGEALKRGDALGVLGKGYSTETDGERKHLHLGIHKGATITVLGYVQKSADLDQWLDARLLLPL